MASSSGGAVCNPDAPVCTPACNGTQLCNALCACETIPTATLGRASRAGAVDITTQDALVAAVNPDANSVTILNTSNNTVAREITGFSHPRAVAFHPNRQTLFVTDGNGLYKLPDVTQASVPGTVLQVCGEPHGVALSPTGARAYVACMDGYVVLVDTTSFAVTQTIALRTATAATGGALPVNASAMGISVTHDGDADDADEKVVVPLFFHEPVAITTPADADLGGLGVVVILGADGTVQRRINLDPEPAVETGFDVGAFMNQLNAVAVDGTLAYITALAASPKGPSGPSASNPDAGVIAGSQNTMPYLLVVDVATGAEVGRLSVNGALRARGTALWMSVLSSVSVVPRTGVVYVTSESSDAVVRLTHAAGAFTVDAAGATHVDLPRGDDSLATAGGEAPVGVVTNHGVTARKAYVINEIGRSIQVLNTATQAVDATVLSTALPTVTAEQQVRMGKRSFIRSTGFWGNAGMVGCLACHPGNGSYSDNVTWFFPAGPRQTPAMDAMFGKQGDVNTGAPDRLDHRVQNWTANFDELADVEGVARNVAGGVGGIVNSLTVALGSRINTATAGADGGPAQFLRGSSRDLVLTQSAYPNWEFMEQWSLGIPSPRAPRALDAAAVTRGRAVFETGNCMQCHAGSKWTVSRVPYDPSTLVAGEWAAEVAHRTSYDAGVTPLHHDGLVISPDDAPQNVDAGFPNPRLERLACAVRDVGTYFLPGGTQNPLEVRQNLNAANHSAGRNGYNIPSLLGLRYSAPYLHHGAAPTLTALFTDARWSTHTTAGNATFAPTANDVADLVAFLESIDDTTQVMAIPAGAIICPNVQ